MHKLSYCYLGAGSYPVSQSVVWQDSRRHLVSKRDKLELGLGHKLGLEQGLGHRLELEHRLGPGHRLEQVRGIHPCGAWWDSCQGRAPPRTWHQRGTACTRPRSSPRSEPCSPGAPHGTGLDDREELMSVLRVPGSRQSSTSGKTGLLYSSSTLPHYLLL